MNKQHQNIRFSVEAERLVVILLLILKYIEKMENLLEKMEKLCVHKFYQFYSTRIQDIFIFLPFLSGVFL